MSLEYDKIPPYKTSDKNSFAFVSAYSRWPTIITQAIDDVFRATRNATDETQTREGRKIVEELAKLKYEVQHNRVLTPLPDDGLPDIADYNRTLESLGEPTWFEISWLFSECYMYRRMSSYFQLSTKWKSYDFFLGSKLKTLRSSIAAILELAHRYSSITTTPHPTEDEATFLLFHEIFMICLWGNATDLSLLATVSYEDIQSLQGSHARKESAKNVLVDDSDKVYKLLTSLQKQGGERRIDIVLDNSGFELFVDLFLAGYLLSNDFATQIVLHPKNHPWFVSDVLPSDFGILLNALQDPVEFFIKQNTDENANIPELKEQDVSAIKGVFESLAGYHADGKLTIRSNSYWTLGDPFWTLASKENEELWNDLKSSELVIFKGDLNYRKLLGDADWDPTTPFDAALGPIGKGSGCRSLALRTCKADVVVGLSEGTDERIRKEDPANAEDQQKRKWAWSGKYAVVQYCDGKS